MIELGGILTENTPFNIHENVGVLLFAHYPTTIILSDKNKEPIIKEWVDCSDDNKIDRFFYYRTDTISLKQFLDGNISHLDLINTAREGFVIFQDETLDEVLEKRALTLSSIPLSYKPNPNFFFDYSDSVDITDIFDYFNLDNLNVTKAISGLVKDISFKTNNETLYVKLNKGRGVGNGTINIDTFGRTITSFNKLYKHIALDYLLGVKRGDIDIEAKKYEDYLNYTQTELFENRIAASYGFLVKPVIFSQTNLFNEETETQKIATQIFNLINNSSTIDTLKTEYVLHSGFTLNSFKQFLDTILKSQLDIDLNWFSPINKQEMIAKLDYHKANQLINDIDSLATVNQMTFKVKGKFRAVHCDTRHYNFIELNEQQYSGYFDKILKDGLTNVNFIDIYEVTIERQNIESTGTDSKFHDTIISYYKEE